MALLVAATGCSATSPAEVAPTPNIDATVEARVQATSEAAAAIQATADLLEEFNRVERAWSFSPWSSAIGNYNRWKGRMVKPLE